MKLSKVFDLLWYENNSSLKWLLLPVTQLFCTLVWLRRIAFKLHLFRSYKVSALVIIVGNLSVGGSGKTPLVVYLANFLRQHGYRPGIVSRGYGGKAKNWPQQVRADSDPVTVGDEPVLMANRCPCPICVGPDRVSAAKALLDTHACDIVVSDDGLQHYRLKRDIEIVVMDGQRRLGNALCLPAGPLREPASRLQQADFIISTGNAEAGEFPMRLIGDVAYNLLNSKDTRKLATFCGETVHAIAGIGNPKRFFAHLEEYEITVIPHDFPDHHQFTADDIDFDDPCPILMTEKDAVKCTRIANSRHWVVPVNAYLPEDFEQNLLALIEDKLSNTK